MNLGWIRTNSQEKFHSASVDMTAPSMMKTMCGEPLVVDDLPFEFNKKPVPVMRCAACLVGTALTIAGPSDSVEVIPCRA